MRPLGLALVAVLLSVAVPVAIAGVSMGRASATGAAVDLPDMLLVAQWPTSASTALGYLTQRQLAVLLPFRNSRSKTKYTSWSVLPSSMAA